jgi:hypothetical protein
MRPLTVGNLPVQYVVLSTVPVPVLPVLVFYVFYHMILSYIIYLFVLPSPKKRPFGRINNGYVTAVAVGQRGCLISGIRIFIGYGIRVRVLCYLSFL